MDDVKSPAEALPDEKPEGFGEKNAVIAQIRRNAAAQMHHRQAIYADSPAHRFRLLGFIVCQADQIDLHPSLDHGRGCAIGARVRREVGIEQDRSALAAQCGCAVAWLRDTLHRLRDGIQGFLAGAAGSLEPCRQMPRPPARPPPPPGAGTPSCFFARARGSPSTLPQNPGGGACKTPPPYRPRTC